MDTLIAISFKMLSLAGRRCYVLYFTRSCLNVPIKPVKTILQSLKLSQLLTYHEGQNLEISNTCKHVKKNLSSFRCTACERKLWNTAEQKLPQTLTPDFLWPYIREENVDYLVLQIKLSLKLKVKFFKAELCIYT